MAVRNWTEPTTPIRRSPPRLRLRPARRSCSRTVSCRPQRKLLRGSRQPAVVPLQPTKSSKLTAFLERQKGGLQRLPSFCLANSAQWYPYSRMVRFRIPLTSLKSWFSVVALTVCASLPAQDHSKHERTVPSPIEPKPFSTIATRQTPVYTVNSDLRMNSRNRIAC